MNGRPSKFFNNAAYESLLYSGEIIEIPAASIDLEIQEGHFDLDETIRQTNSLFSQQ